MEGNVPFARITKPHGVRGEIKAAPLSDDVGELAFLESFETLLIERNGAVTEYPLRQIRFQPKNAILSLEGIDSVEQANALRGGVVVVPAQQLPAPEEDEVYVGDMLGMDVVREDGSMFGTITGHFVTKANDVFEVQTPAGSVVNLPFTNDVFIEIELDSKRAVVNAEGYGQ